MRFGYFYCVDSEEIVCFYWLAWIVWLFTKIVIGCLLLIFLRLNIYYRLSINVTMTIGITTRTSLWPCLKPLSALELNINILLQLLLQPFYLIPWPLFHLYSTLSYHRYFLQMCISTRIFTNLYDLSLLAVNKFLSIHRLHKFSLWLSEVLVLRLDAFQKLLLFLHLFLLLELSCS